jgi:NTE family protein
MGLAAALAACGTAPQNYPLAAGAANPKPAPYQVAPGHPFVALAFSGGGSRAALLGAAVTNQLATLTYTAPDGQSRRVSDDIAAVSSVSGGSLYAGYVGIYGTGQPGHTPAEFETFVQNFDGMSYLISAALNPFTWIGLAAHNTTRIAVLENMIAVALGPDGKTPSTATLASIARPGAPTILLNASDVVSGQVFTFDKATMDDLCLSMADTPVATAVSASAAFPVAFTPVLLRNNSLSDGSQPGPAIGAAVPNACTRPAAGDWMNNVNDPAGPYTDLEEFRHDVARAAYRGVTNAYGLSPRRTPVFIRLADGGVVDNLGLTSLRRALLMQGSPIDLTPILRDLPAGAKLPIVLIEVNSRSDPISPLDTSPKYTTLLDQASADSGTLVDSAAAGSGTIFQNFVRELQRSLREGGLADRVALYPMQIDFDRLPDTSPASRDFLNRVKSIATSWTLKPGDRDLLDQAATQLLAREPCYAQLQSDLHLTGGPPPAPIPNTSCPTAIPPVSAME